MPTLAAAMSSSRMDMIARPYLERTKQYIIVTHTTMIQNTMYRSFIFMMPISAWPAWPLARPLPPAMGRFWMMTRMISPKPSVMIAR